MKYLVGIVLFLLVTGTIYSQVRISDNNSIGWYNLFSTIKMSKKVGLHTEFQCRRSEWITDGQQNLLRVGFNYQPDANLLLRLGCARVETFSYGEIPINIYGKSFSENRIYEMVMLKHTYRKFDISHRFMLEQRFTGKYSRPELAKEDLTVYSNRVRYMFRTNIPFLKKKNSPYFNAYDELFISFGKNIGENVFDQNRVAMLAGFPLNKQLKLEAGFLNQTLQLSREVDGKNVFQYNSGLIVNMLMEFGTGK